MQKNLDALTEKLGHTFKEADSLKHALTHRSVMGEKNNERLEFLGDSIVNFVIAAALYEQFPKSTEGELTRLRARLVNGETLITNDQDFVRDFVVPVDLASMIECCIKAWRNAGNDAINCGFDFYSKSPAGKFEIIDRISEFFPLRFEIEKTADTVAPTGAKSQYFSTFRKAAAWGFEPKFTTTQGILSEIYRLLETRT